MKRTLMWIALLSKRLYKKITFLCILLLIPILVVAFDGAAQSESGIVTVLLACEDPQDAMAQGIVQRLMADPGVLLLHQCDANTAAEQVQAGKADTAWIFPADMEQKLMAFAESGGTGPGVVRVVERESTVAVRLAREKLSAALYEQCSKYVYLRYIRDSVPESKEISDEALLNYLAQTDVQGELFAFYDISGNEKAPDASYLTAPLRGLLAVVVAIAAMVTAMYYQKDLERGMFALLQEKKRFFSELMYQLVSALNLMIAVFFALLISGLCTNILSELIWLLLYSLCCSVFGMTLRWLFGGKHWMSALLPAVAVLMLAVCPVFFDLPGLNKLQLLFPPTYYIQGVYNPAMILSCGTYILCMLLVCFAWAWLRSLIGKRRKKSESN